MTGFFGGLISGLIVALILVVGGTAPIPTLVVRIVVLAVVWLAITIVQRFIAQRRAPGPRFRLLAPDTVALKLDQLSEG